MRCAAVATRIIVVEGPSRGDGIQAEKAGLLELADLIVVNKSDLEGAERVVNDLTISLTLTNDAPPIIRTSAIEGEGLDELAAMILSLEERTSSRRARARQQLLMAHENILILNPAFDAIIDRMCEEGIGVEEALRNLDE
jgi:LAO/AO transport system kinase